jgi:hypothetical protein
MNKLEGYYLSLTLSLKEGGTKIKEIDTLMGPTAIKSIKWGFKFEFRDVM